MGRLTPLHGIARVANISDIHSVQGLMTSNTITRAMKLFLAVSFAVVVTAETSQTTFEPRGPLISRTRLTSDEYNEHSKDLLEHGYKASYLSGYTINNEPHFAGIWELPKDSLNSTQIIQIGLNSSEYQTEFDDLASKGYRLALVNGYTVNESDQYVAIWDNAPSPPWVAKHGMTATELQTIFNDLVVKGYRGTHLCGYDVGGEAHYAAILEKTSGPLWSAWAGMTKRMFQERVDVLRAHGFRVIDFNGYGVNDLDFYAAVWEYHDGTTGDWIERHRMKYGEYEREQARNSEAGYILKVLSGYTLNGMDFYAGLWVHKDANQ